MLLLWVRTSLPDDLHVDFVEGRLVLVFSDWNVTSAWQQRFSSGNQEKHVRVPELWRAVHAGQYIGPMTYGGSFTPGAPVPVLNAPPVIQSILGIESITEMIGTSPAN